MALNYLLHRHQVSLVRAECAATSESRIVHRKFAALYAQRIGALSAIAGSDFFLQSDDGVRGPDSSARNVSLAGASAGRPE